MEVASRWLRAQQGTGQPPEQSSGGSQARVHGMPPVAKAPEASRTLKLRVGNVRPSPGGGGICPNSPPPPQKVVWLGQMAGVVIRRKRRCTR